MVVIGEEEVGKSNVISVFIKNQFNPNHIATIGVEFSNKEIIIEKKKIKLQVWDTGKKLFQLRS